MHKIVLTIPYYCSCSILAEGPLCVALFPAHQNDAKYFEQGEQLSVLVFRLVLDIDFSIIRTDDRMIFPCWMVHMALFNTSL